MRVKAPNGVVHFETPYPVSISTFYDASRNIPTTISWLNQKYFRYFFENQKRFIEAATGAKTPYVRFRVDIPETVDGSGDNIEIILSGNAATTAYSSQNSNSHMICQLLPATTTDGQRDFSVGLFAPCYKDTSTNPHKYHLDFHGTLNAGTDYLIQI